MRGDRLLKILLLLQSRGRMRVADLAAELEVSVRTVYRDLVALDTAGVPIVTERGPGGGCALVDGYTTRLTGLTEEEGAALAIALLSAGAPSGPAVLGMGAAYESARLKLSAALPARLRGGEAATRARILVDSGAAEEGAWPMLSILHGALMRGDALRLVQVLPYGPVAGMSILREVEPYGLVATGRDWRLVGRSDGRIRCIRVDDIHEASPIEGRSVEIPGGFDLRRYWDGIRSEEERQSGSFRALVRVEPKAAMILAPRFGRSLAERLRRAGPPGPDGRVEVELEFSAVEEAAILLLLLGAAAEVLSPAALRSAVEDRARAALSVYDTAGRVRSGS